MAEVVLYHHSQGLTDGVKAFADELRRAGHTVHLPDLYDGHTFGTLDEGLDYARTTGFGAVKDRGIAAAEGLPEAVVYAGFSLGVMPAQELTQTRPGATGALFYYSCLPVEEFGAWPDGVPVQIHGMDEDPFFAKGGDLDAARELVETVGPALSELFVYPGERHLFTDSSLASYDSEATALVVERSRAFLDRIS
jgi:dienelactone hydrolase